MARYRITERQVVEYTWYREANSADEAEASALDGVPDDATSHLVNSETWAAEDDG